MAGVCNGHYYLSFFKRIDAYIYKEKHFANIVFGSLPEGESWGQAKTHSKSTSTKRQMNICSF